MDITTPIDTIVNNLVRDIETRLNDRVDRIVTQHLQAKLDAVDYDSRLNLLASAKLDNLIGDMEVDQSSVQERVDRVADIVVNNIENDARRIAVEMVKKQLYNEIDINQMVRSIISEELTAKLATFNFPDRSIPGAAINPLGLNITGNNVTGGVIKNFNSSGIEDKSNSVQMTLLDQAVVIENKVITAGLEVHGTTVIEGDLHLNGDVPEDSAFYQQILKHTVQNTKDSLTTEMFQGYSHVMFDLIKDKGLDLNKLSMNGQPVIEGNKLNYGISDTNITRLGLVRDLQTTGEALLVNTLYVNNDRVGINTIEPGHALSVWDQEVEIGFGKRQKNTAWLGTPREHDLIIGTNGNDNLILRTDGSIETQRMTIKGMEISSAAEAPSHDANPGSIVFTATPIPGGPVGWMSLGGGKWSRFGTLG